MATRRVSHRDALDGYTEGLHVPGTIDHVLQIVQRWFEDMGLLRSALTGLAAKPTLLIWGDRDRAVGLNSARELQRMLPQSSLMVLPGVGHIAFEEMPDVCNQAMRDWLLNPIGHRAPITDEPPARRPSSSRPPSTNAAQPDLASNLAQAKLTPQPGTNLLLHQRPASLRVSPSFPERSDRLPQSTPAASAPERAQTPLPSPHAAHTDRDRR